MRSIYRILMMLALGALMLGRGPLAHAKESASGTRSETTTYKMSNGMDVILKENHSSPMIASIVFVKSGAKYETEYNNGVTHFLEHLLFDGTATRTQEQISDRIKNLGGYINAFTQKELTAYMSLIPAEYVGEALDIQQDMLFNSIFPDDRFPKERKIVIEEIRKDTDNPDYIAEQFYDSWAYQGSPYARPVLGYENLIATIPRQEVMDYYHTYYQPNNMILLVIGDFKTAAMQKMLDETFGRHPAQPIPPRTAIIVPPVKGTTVKQTEADIAETHIDFHFRLPVFTDPSYLPFNLLVEILNSRAVSPLQKSLTEGENPLATEATASLETQSEFSALHLSIKTDSAGKTDAIIAAVEKIVRELPSLSVPPEDLAATVTRLKVQDLFLRERLHYYAMMKAPMLVVTGYEFMDQLPDRMGKVTLADIRQMAAKYLSADNCVATIVTPKTTASADTAAATGMKAATFAKRTLSNGLVAIVKSNPDSRVFAINVLGKYRAACEPEGAIGISDFVNRMLVSGTEKRDANQINRDLTAIGADLTTNDNPYIPYDDQYTTAQFTFVKFATIDEFAPKGIELLADMLDHSIFPPDEIAKTQKKAMGILGMASGSTGQTCRELYLSKMFGDGPYARPVMGTQATVMGFTSDALKKHLHALYAPENMIVTCATNLSIDSTFALLEGSLGKILAGTPPAVTIPKPVAPKGIVSAHKQMQKEQVYIYLGGLLPGASSPDAPAIMVANQILSARLGAELREKQGLAYSVGSSVRFDKDFGWLTCAMGTGKKNYATARDGILGEIRRLRNEPPTAEEISIAQNSIWGSTLTAQLSRVTQAYYMGMDEFIGVGYDHGEHLLELVRSVKPTDVQRVAKQYFDADNYVLATVGNLE